MTILNEQRLRAAIRSWARESGKRMQSRRRELNLSQSAVAEAVGVSTGTISKAELGVIVPKDSVRVAIAATLLCEVDELWSYPDRASVMAIAREVAA